MNFIPIILLAAIWAGFATLVKLAELLNERRDTILDTAGKLSYRHRLRVLYSDWLIYLGMVIFHLMVFAIVFALLPTLLQSNGLAQNNGDVVLQVLCYFAATSPILFIVITIVSGIKDYRLMVYFLETNKARFDEANIPIPERASRDN
jgi:hypothetical protein